jgi:DNA polymerase III alpha subunit
VPEISLAAVWNGPALDDAASKWKDNAKVGALVSRLAARRTPLDEAEKMIAEFISDSAVQKGETGKLLFAGLFDTLNVQRSSVMSGLERVTRKQREAADKIRTDTMALQALLDAPTPDQAKIDELGNQLAWETRIFEDRRRVIKFVCEVPTAIDQRLFALGRVIQQEME